MQATAAPVVHSSSMIPAPAAPTTNHQSNDNTQPQADAAKKPNTTPTQPAPVATDVNMQQHSLPNADADTLPTPSATTTTAGAAPVATEQPKPIIASQIDAASPLKQCANANSVTTCADETGPIAPDLNFPPDLPLMQPNPNQHIKSRPTGSVPPRPATNAPTTNANPDAPNVPQPTPSPQPPVASNKAARVRSASQMLDIVTTTETAEQQARPTKRIALPKSNAVHSPPPLGEQPPAPAAPSASPSNLTSSASESAGNKSSTTAAPESPPNPTQGKTSNLAGVQPQPMPVEPPRVALRSGQPVIKPLAPQSNASASVAMPSKPPPVVGARPVFRSAPAAAGGTKAPVADPNVKERKQAPKKARSKPKSVSWKKDSELVHVVNIHNRMDLIRSWDPDSEITLPFAPVTLANFRAAIASEDNAAKNPPNTPMHDAFAPDSTQKDMDEARRKLEHFRLEQKRKLDAMKPSTEWPARQYQVILPAECKIEENVFVFTICQSGADSRVDGNVKFPVLPRSPPRSDEHPLSSPIDVPWYDPSAVRKDEMDTSGSGSHAQDEQHRNQSHSFQPNGAQPQFRSQPFDANPQNAQYQPQYRQQNYQPRDDHINGAPPYGNNPFPPPNRFGHQPTPISSIPQGDLQRLLTTLQEQGMGPPPGTPGFHSTPGAPPPYFMPAPPPPPPPPHMVHLMPGPPPPPGNSHQRFQHQHQHQHQRQQNLRRNKKKCKYFGTKNGCRDGDACTFSHEI